MVHLENLYGDCSITWSPDDCQIAFDARSTSDSASHIWIVNVATKEVVQFTTLQGNSFRPDWSHNGEDIVFCNNGMLYIQPVAGGSATQIPNTYQPSNPTWSYDDSQILFGRGEDSPDIYRINRDGTELVEMAPGNSGMREQWSRLSPEGDSLLYLDFIEETVAHIILKSLDSGIEHDLTEFGDSRFPDFAPCGEKFVFQYGDDLWIYEFTG